MIKFTFSNLSQTEFYQLACKTDEIISHWPVKEMGIELYYLSFKKALDNFIKQKECFSDDLVLLHHKAIVREEYCHSFFIHVESYLCYPDDEIKEQVKHLLLTITKFNPDIHNRCCRTETIVLQTVIGRIELGYKELLKKIHATDWFNLLKNAQVDFEKSLKKYLLKYKDNEEFNLLLNAQPELIASLKRLFVLLPMQYELTNNEHLGKIIKLLNAEVNKF